MTVNVYTFLLHRWEDTFGQNSISIDVFAELIKKYNEIHRAYHRPEHIMDCLLAVDTALPYNDPHILPGSEELIEAALFFHDVIYVPGNSDNELLSAEYAYKELTRLGLDSGFCGRVGDLICDTKNHKPQARDFVSGYVCDADLDILSASTPTYIKYVAGIRKEYDMFTDEQWIEGRSAFIESMLERECLYNIDMNLYLDHSARKNLIHELGRLKEGQILGSTVVHL